MLDGFILGLSSGIYCATSCAPVILPLVFGEDQASGKKNVAMVGLFMLGRFFGYVAAGFILGAIGAYAVSYLDPVTARMFRRISHGLAGAFLLLGGLLHNFPELKVCEVYKKMYRPGRNALILGLITGFSLCPPFFAAAAKVFGTHGSFSGAVYFLLFSLGTSVYFLPLLGVHFLFKHLGKIQMVARMAMILIGVYYLLFIGIFGAI